MNHQGSLQKRMDDAFLNYFELSKTLRADMKALLYGDHQSQHWRRNFIRAGAALIEGYAFCLREICAISLECSAPEISKKEAAVLRNEKGFDANDRVKLTLRAAYRLFGLPGEPDFGGSEWANAQKVLSKRHLLMHPKSIAGLEVSDEQWKEIHFGFTWLVGQFLNLLVFLQEKHSP